MFLIKLFFDRNLVLTEKNSVEKKFSAKKFKKYKVKKICQKNMISILGLQLTIPFIEEIHR